MIRITHVLACCAVLVLFLHLPATAAYVPTTLSYQGSLNDKGGNPVTASKTLVFSLYNQQSGGSAIWSESQSLTVTAGRFGAVLGLVTPLDVSMLSGDTWLGIAVQGEPEMAPRQKLTSVAYAFKAQETEKVTSTDNIIPPGYVSAFSGTTAPAGWLMCDGSQVSRSTYSRLFSKIGVNHGAGNGTTTFNLPDYRGRFLRGVDGGAGRDPNSLARTPMNISGIPGDFVGSVQDDNFRIHGHLWFTGNDSPDHSHTYDFTQNVPGLLKPQGDYYAVTGGFPGYNTGGASTRHFHSISPDGGNESRPVNAYVNWIIKY